MVRVLLVAASITFSALIPFESVVAQDHSFRVFLENDIRIIETTGGPKYEGELFRYEPVLTLMEDEREESLLYNPGEFVTDDDGLFYVVDSDNHRIAVFDFNGRYSHSFGRFGGGPGEFQYLRLQYVRDDIVSVYDFSFRRTTRYTTGGSLVDVTSFITHGDTFLSATDANDNKHVLISLEIPVEGDFREYEWIHVTILDSLMRPVVEKEFNKARNRYLGLMRTGGREYSESYWYHYGARPMCIYHNKYGIVYSSGWEPILEFYNLDGIHTQTVSLDLEPERISRREKRYIEKFYAERIERNTGFVSDMFKFELGSMQYPDHKAYWSEIEIDDNGYFWLQFPMYRYFEIDRDREGLLYRVLSPEGEYLGITRRPKGSSRVSQGLLLVSSRNRETDEITPTVYSIIPAVEGLKFPDGSW